MTAILSPGVSTWTAPTWFRSFYNTFPLVVLPQDDQLEWKAHAKQLPPQSSVLWIHPSSPHAHPHHRPWLSSNPASLRTQLLFLLRHTAAQPLVAFKEWPVESSAPNGTLPALHIPSQERLLPTDEIRGWLEGTYPLEGTNEEWQGLPSQESYDKALALSQLILTHLLPAYLASLPSPSSSSRIPLHLHFPIPPPLYAGLTTPLPASLTGDKRDIDIDQVLRKGQEAVDVVDGLLDEDGWALGAKRPTSLDALLASHLYILFTLPKNSFLRGAVQGKQGVEKYIERVLEYAEKRRM
ncbi:hypothetical protein I305_02341 [Cryptococcus gattii E566]|uniref:Metaxin glutathione S-transferase domain-containing protein n=2 Tax=Cryptococcus gattii TaxID=37769 RepID=E6RDW6_CRYGW|nr:Hypothetical protein CGB_K3680W [Cryptococcus gattii WM276]ADV24985.1 Hypothetical protein CGB_K3680W [Cryptococcus gattii WM276]KIR79073.1 hypothetical protein I306_03923 [Cryptococcus gattii EJB2]KIY35431.1 hypothetical protein I305_02341 [Cryptococcus gattii E566]KJD99753.1 hypothetical protein I311_06649 [Cryptococcus gattii NT-10]